MFTSIWPFVCRACRGLTLCFWLAACGADAGVVVDGVWQPPEQGPAGVEAPLAQTPGALTGTEAGAADTCPAAQEVPSSALASDAAHAPMDAPQHPLAAAVTLDITNDPAEPGPWPQAHVRCDGIRIAPSVILTAAHCFAWHRAADSEASVVAQVRVRSASDPDAGVDAVHVAVHPRYPALACSQPSRSAAAACLRAASQCVAVHGLDALRRSACLQGVSEQVIEAQHHASYDLALVFVTPSAPRDAPLPCAILAREGASGPQGQVWLSPTGMADDAWQGAVGDEPPPRLLPWALQPAHSTRTSFDLRPVPPPGTRLFDGAFARSPKPGAPLHLLAWASRDVAERPAHLGPPFVRYTRLKPHLIWLADTVASVARAYPQWRLQGLDIVDIGLDTGL